MPSPRRRRVGSPGTTSSISCRRRPHVARLVGRAAFSPAYDRDGKTALPSQPVHRGLDSAAVYGARHHTNTGQTELGRVRTLRNGALRLTIARDPGEPLRWIIPDMSGPLVERCPPVARDFPGLGIQ